MPPDNSIVDLSPAAAVTDPAPAAAVPADPSPLGDAIVTDPAPAPAADPASTDPKPAEAIVYDFELPEGLELDAEIGAKFKDFATAKNLSKEDAQALLNMSLELETKKAKAFEQTKSQWATESEADTEFGGTQFKENLAVANKALDAFGTPELKSLLKSTGFGNHPEVIRAFVKIGRSVGEDKLIVRGTNTPQAVNTDPIAKRMYPKMNP